MEREKKSNKKNFGRSEKRKFHGNRFTKKDKTSVVDSVSSGLSTDGISASRRKLGKSIAQRQQNINKDSNFDNYFCLINFAILKDMFSLLMCPCCSSNVMLSDKSSSRMGFAYCLEIVCNICDWRQSFYTSKTCDTKNSLSQG